MSLGFATCLLVTWKDESSICMRLSGITNWGMTSMSLHALLALTLDRFILINWPLHYPLIMTKQRTFLILFTCFLMGIIWSLFGYLTFQLPAEDPQGLICSILHNHQSWWLSFASIFYILAYVTIFTIYSTLVYKFRQSRKRLEKLQNSLDDDYMMPKLTFHQIRGLLRKQMLFVPGSYQDPIQTLSVKSLEKDREIVSRENMNRFRKRRRSSVIDKAAALISHIRASFYVLVIVTMNGIGFLPPFFYILYDNINHMIEDDRYTDYSNTNISSTVLMNCLRMAVQNTECNIAVEFEENFLPELQDQIRNIYHISSSELFLDLVGCHFSVIICLANPIFYGLWYSEFRANVMQIPSWFKKKKEDSSTMDTPDIPGIITVMR